MTLNFVSTRAFYSCFEYRTDGDTTQILTENGGENYNTLVTDGLYPYICENNSSRTKTIYAYEYVEVRMVFGAETDERFDWTRFDVLPVPADKEQCKDGGWMELLWTRWSHLLIKDNVSNLFSLGNNNNILTLSDEVWFFDQTSF